MAKLLVIDNYDSFTYNLVHYLEKIMDHEVVVKRNDEIRIDEVDGYSHIVLSPGPGLPKDAGMMPAIIKYYAATKTILGICLGHQALAEAFGGTLYNMGTVHHGVATPVKMNLQHFLFKGLPDVIETGRYHSWAVQKEGLPVCFDVIAEDGAGVIMGIQHRQYALTGVQFHPESILTPDGYTILRNWAQQTALKR